MSLLSENREMLELRVRPLTSDDRAWATNLLSKEWGSSRVISRGRIHQADQLPGFVASRDREMLGLVTYSLLEDECEIVTLNSLQERKGIGTALVAAVKEIALATRCQRLWLITTNDNLAALRFYQKLGFTLVAVHHNALAESRRLKPEIPPLGRAGIPLRDEIELEIRL